MLKLVLYLILTAVGVAGSLVSPAVGVIACIDAYLLNPAAIQMENYGIRFQLIATVAFLLGFLIHRPQAVQKVGREGGLAVALWVFVAVGALSSLWAVVSSANALNDIYEMFKTVLLATMLIRAITDERQMRWVIIACILGVWHAAALHVFGVRLGFISSALGREEGVLPDYQTGVMVLFVPLLVLLAMLGSKTERILSWLALPFVLDSVVGTYQRAGFVCLAAEGLLFAILVPRRITFRLLPVLAITATLFAFRFTPENYWKWVGTITRPREEASANSRFAVDDASIRMFLDYPMGVGYRNYPDVSPRYLPKDLLTGGRRSAHNSFFAILCETGIFGFIPWICAFGGAIWLMRRLRRSRDGGNLDNLAMYALGIELGLYGWMVGGLFHAMHEVDPAYWFVGFAVVLTRLQGQRAEREEHGDAADSGDLVPA
jgi:O-antigen ligase